MPHISTAMTRSLRRGVGEILVSSLLRRDTVTSATGEVSSVKNTFSSWDNCMKASYCKWPVIAAIVVVSLVLLSIITCIVRCACCGYSCCCACFSCLKCCDCCGDCCEGKKNKPMKHLDDEPFGGGAFSSAPARQGYQAPAPMMGGGLGGMPEKPQFATFEVGRSGLAVDPKPTLSEDALPPMPSWDSAAKKHVPDEEKDAVELGELDPVTGQKMPLMTGAAVTGPPSPAIGGSQSPYGGRPGQANGYMNVPGDQYGQTQAAFDGNDRAYGGQQDAFAAGGRPYGNSSSRPGDRQRGGYANGQGRGYDNGAGRGYNGQGRGYGEAISPQDPYAPQEMYADNAGFVEGPAVGGYGRPQPGREYSNDSSRPLNPGRQYSDRQGFPADNFQPRGPPRGPPRNGSPALNNNGFQPSRQPGPNRMASPALNNNSGFDFGGGEQPYRRGSPGPQQAGYGNPNQGQRRPIQPIQKPDEIDDYYGGGGSTAPPSYATRSPPPREQQQDVGYPGYRPYQPSNSRGQGGRGGGREPQRWDPVQQ